MSLRRRWVGIVLVVGVISAAAFAAIQPAVERGKQIQSYAVLQQMGHVVSRLPVNERTRDSIERAISTVVGGRDAWGNPVHVYIDESGSALRYVLVSDGSDGRPDIAASDYFRMLPGDVRRQTKRDLVFRDGEMITFAGK
jgi:hypothetical protein